MTRGDSTQFINTDYHFSLKPSSPSHLLQLLPTIRNLSTIIYLAASINQSSRIYEPADYDASRPDSKPVWRPRGSPFEDALGGLEDLAASCFGFFEEESNTDEFEALESRINREFIVMIKVPRNYLRSQGRSVW